MKKFLIILVILILVGAVGYVAWQKIGSGEGGNTPGPDVTPTPITESKVDAKEYPKIKSFKNASMQNYINTQIADNILKYVQEINYIVDEDTKPEEIYRYTTSYERFNYGKYLFLVVSQNYETGGIRTNKWKDIYSINVETERIIYLSEMFEVGVKYEQAIISEITKQAAEKNIELMGGNGLKKLPQKQSFYIDQNGKLIIYFPPSEAAATVFGELSFEMPFKLNSQGYFEID